MTFLYFFLIPILYLPVKLILYIIVFRYGKFSYDGFSAAGFAFSSKKNVFYSTKNAWQKNYGYCHLYDLGAPLFNMIIDTEPIKFYYNDKNWLITFWKGQYVMTTGAEIGIYSTDEQKVNKKTLYFSSDKEMLDMSFTLYKKKKEIIRIHAKHWWLAAFKLGMFSNPRNLTMDIKLTFPNKEMLDAFTQSFMKLGYKSKHFNIVDNTFYFTFKRPRTHKVWTRSIIADAIRQSYNRRNVKIYNRYLKNVIDNNKIDDSKLNNKKMILLKEMVPDILKNKMDDKSEYVAIAKIDNKIESDMPNNIIFFNNDIFSNVRRYSDE